MSNYKGIARIGGKEYECEVIDGVRYIQGMTVPEFAQTLDPVTLARLAMMGATAIEFEQAGIELPAQATLSSLENNEIVS